MSQLGVQNQNSLFINSTLQNHDIADKLKLSMKESLQATIKKAEEQKVEKMFWNAFSKNDLQNRAYLMKDPLVKKLYEKMHKNRIIRDYRTQAIHGIKPDFGVHNCKSKHEQNSFEFSNEPVSYSSNRNYKVYLKQQIIDDSFEVNTEFRLTFQ